MAKWQYTRGRRVMLQVIMWLLFAACMGMAALVTSHRRSEYAVEFTAPMTLGPFQVQLPESWQPREWRRGGLRYIEAVEPVGQMKGRTQRVLRLYHEKLPEPMFAHTYLRYQPLLGYDNSFFGGGSGGTRDASEFDRMRIAGVEGVVSERVVQRRDLWRTQPPVAEFYAAIVTADGNALVAKLVCDPAGTPVDRALFRQVLELISLNPK